MVVSYGNGCNIAGHYLFRSVGSNIRINVVVSAIAQLAFIVTAHNPETAVALEKQGVQPTSANRRDVAGHYLLGPIGAKAEVERAAVA